jgi:multidrug resistance efflux pump
MDLLIVLTYAALCYGAFKVFRIPVNKWTVPTAVLGGVVLVGFIVLFMNYNHPYSKDGRLYFVTMPVVPQVRGRVVEVPVAPNAPLKAGDILFRIDDTPYKTKVDERRAALADAEQKVLQMRAAVEAANARVEAVAAERDRARSQYERYLAANENAGKAKPFSELQVDNQRQLYLTKEAELVGAKAEALQAKIAAEAQIGGVNTAVAQIAAQLAEAEYDLAQTVVRAPGDGFVTQVALRPGVMAVPLPLAPVMVFVPAEDQTFAGAFLQNYLQRIAPGHEAEIAFDAIPGRVFKARVRSTLDAIAQGQIQPGGAILDPASRKGAGYAIVTFDIVDDLSGYHLPAGSAGQVAVYTEHWHAFAIIRKILLRMLSWQNYVFH